jgi:hypothetical protein
MGNTDDQCAEQTTNLLLERLRAWKHMCGYLEDYVEVTAKVQKSQAKDYEKVLKVWSLVHDGIGRVLILPGRL